MGDRGIMISGGTLNLHGNRKNTWTKLAKTAEAGSNSIEVLNAAEWRAGDEIVLASTGLLIPGRPSVAPLPPSAATRSRWTRSSTTCTSARSPSTWMNAARVGLLTRNVKVQGIGRCGADLLRRPHHGDGHQQDVRRGRRTQSHGPEPDPRPGTPSTGILSATRRASTSGTRPSTTHYNRCVTVHGTN